MYGSVYVCPRTGITPSTLNNKPSLILIPMRMVVAVGGLVLCLLCPLLGSSCDELLMAWFSSCMAWTLGDNVDKYRKNVWKVLWSHRPTTMSMWPWRWRWRAALQHRKRNLARRRPTIPTISDRTTQGKYYLFSFFLFLFLFLQK